MCPTTDGSGEELEKFPDAIAPPEIHIHTPNGGTYAGLRDLDHCKVSWTLLFLVADSICDRQE